MRFAKIETRSNFIKNTVVINNVRFVNSAMFSSEWTIFLNENVDIKITTIFLSDVSKSQKVRFLGKRKRVKKVMSVKLGQDWRMLQ
jgi:hypothetical protein